MRWVLDCRTVSPPDEDFNPEHPTTRSDNIRDRAACYRWTRRNPQPRSAGRSRMAAELAFEHQVVEGQWARWTEAELRDVIADAEARHVGVKVDFLDHEAREVIDHYQSILRDAAEHRLIFARLTP